MPDSIDLLSDAYQNKDVMPNHKLEVFTPLWDIRSSQSGTRTEDQVNHSEGPTTCWCAWACIVEARSHRRRMQVQGAPL
jgi:hypothetical protein